MRAPRAKGYASARIGGEADGVRGRSNKLTAGKVIRHYTRFERPRKLTAHQREETLALGDC
jgi:hypothetical protein